jgi:cold shock CspA family protein
VSLSQSPRANLTTGSDLNGSADATAMLMVTGQRVSIDMAGRIAYIDPSKHWGYLHGPLGERVYFHATTVLGNVSQLELGDGVSYRLADGGDQLCAAQVARLRRAGR